MILARGAAAAVPRPARRPPPARRLRASAARKDAARERRRQLRKAADSYRSARDREYERVEVLEGAGGAQTSQSKAAVADVEDEEEQAVEPGVRYIELEELDVDIIDEANETDEDGLPPPHPAAAEGFDEKRLRMLKEASEALEALESEATQEREAALAVSEEAAAASATAAPMQQLDVVDASPVVAKKKDTVDVSAEPGTTSASAPSAGSDGDAQYVAPNPSPLGEPTDADLEAAATVIDRMLNAGGMLETVISEYSHAGVISPLLVEVCGARAELEEELGRKEEAEACGLLHRRLIAEQKKRAAPPELRLLDECLKCETEEALRKRMSEAFGAQRVDIMDAAWDLAETRIAPTELTVDKVPPAAIIGSIDQVLLADAFTGADIKGLSAKEMLEEAKQRQALEQRLRLIQAIAREYL